MRRAILTLAAVCLASCATTQPPVVQSIGEGYAAGEETPAAFSPEERFARDVARQRLIGSVESTIANWHLRGSYVARQGECNVVNMQNLTLKHATDYLVCGDRVTRAQGVAPSFPAEGKLTRMSVARLAWTNGQAKQTWGGYDIQGRTLGPMRADGCAVVQTTVTYQGMLVDQTQEKICH